MRPVVILILAALPLCAEFLRFEVTFEGVGCASCIESLEGRLRRVRGVERVEVDAGRSLITLHLAPENRVRLASVLSRITQDGTKIVRTKVAARGTIGAGEQGFLFKPSGLTRTYRLELGDNIKPQPEVMYRVEGVTRGSESVLTAASVELENGDGAGQ